MQRREVIETLLVEVYAEQDDITFIFKDTIDVTNEPNDNGGKFGTGGKLLSRELIGWYCGEPNDSDTERHSNGEMKATFVD